MSSSKLAQSRQRAEDEAFLDYQLKQASASRQAMLRDQSKMSMAETAASNASSILGVIHGPRSGKERSGIRSFYDDAPDPDDVESEKDELQRLEEQVREAVPVSIRFAVEDHSSEAAIANKLDGKRSHNRPSADAQFDFEVDEMALMKVRGGKPLPTPPTDGPNGAILRRMRGEKEYDVNAINDEIGAYSSSDDEAPERQPAGPSSSLQRTSSMSQVGWSRAETADTFVDIPSGNAPAAAASLVPNDSYCHFLSRLFNTLRTNDLVFVEAEDDVFNSTVDNAVFQTKVTVLSPSDGRTLRTYFSSPSNEPCVTCSSQSWRTSQSVLSNILSGRFDLSVFATAANEITRLEKDLERTSKVLRARERDAIHAQRREAALERHLRAQLLQRNEHLVTVVSTAVGLDLALPACDAESVPNLRKLLGHRSANDYDDSSTTADASQWWEELRLVFAKMGELRQQYSKLASLEQGLNKTTSGMSMTRRATGTFGVSGNIQATAGTPFFLSSENIKQELLRSTGKSSFHSSLLGDLEAVQQKKRDRRRL